MASDSGALGDPARREPRPRSCSQRSNAVARRRGPRRAISLERRGHDRAAVAEVAALEDPLPQPGERVDRGGRVVVGERRDEARGGELPGVLRRLLDQLRLAAGEVVVDRAARSTRVREHLGERGGLHAALAHQDRAALSIIRWRGVGPAARDRCGRGLSHLTMTNIILAL